MCSKFISLTVKTSITFQVTSPFYLSLNEGQSEVGVFNGDTIGMYLPLLHIPTKPCAAYCGLSEVLKFKGKQCNYYD